MFYHHCAQCDTDPFVHQHLYATCTAQTWHERRAFMRGYQACTQQPSHCHNPYKNGRIRGNGRRDRCARQWWHGWHVASYERELAYRQRHGRRIWHSEQFNNPHRFLKAY